MRVLTACYEEKTEACTEAVSVLRSPLWLLAGYSVMDVASEAHLMYFLSHPACQEAATKLWSGAIDPSVPAWRVRPIPSLPFPLRPAPPRPATPRSAPPRPEKPHSAPSSLHVPVAIFAHLSLQTKRITTTDRDMCYVQVSCCSTAQVAEGCAVFSGEEEGTTSATT